MNNILFFVLFLVIIIIALYFINYRKKQHFTMKIDYGENELIWNCGKDENGDNVITDPYQKPTLDRTNFLVLEKLEILIMKYINILTVVVIFMLLIILKIFLKINLVIE